MTTPVSVYDRIPVRYFGEHNLVIEYIDGYCDIHECWFDEWRLIDLDTGEVFASDPLPHTALAAACAMIKSKLPAEDWTFTYVPEVKPPPELKKFDEIPLKDKMRHIQSHAQDLEHDFALEGSSRCPLAAALNDYQMRYNDKPCFYNNEDGDWEIYEDCY